MPRLPRKSYETSFFHVIVQGIKKEYIFNTDILIKKYIELLNNELQEYKIQILAYCIMNNHAHILLYTEKVIEMSLFMHKVNQKFAQFYNYINQDRVGYVFRDRYKSEPIFTTQSLIRCIRYIHNNPVKANIVKYAKDYKYSSYEDYCKKRIINMCPIFKEIDIDISLIVDNENNKDYLLDNVFLDVEDNPRELIQTKLLEFKIKNNISLIELIKNKNKIYEFVNEINIMYRIPSKLIVREIGISESTWKRIKKEKIKMRDLSL